jgi:SAM-dependent methyltransferase
VSDWFVDFFDRGYLDRYPPDPDSAEREVSAVVELLGLEPPARILDLACGYGRHSLPLALRGFEVVGYDLSAELLAEARGEARQRGVAPLFLQGDMRELPFEGEFDAAISMFTSFGFFEDEGDHRRVVDGVRAALRPDGLFLLDLINRDAVIRNLQPTMWRDYEHGFVLSANEFEVATSRVRGRQIFLGRDGYMSERRLSLRLFSPHEVKDLLHQGGLAVCTLYGDFDRRGVGLDQPRVIAVARR